MTVRIDWQQAERVCGLLLDAMRKRTFPYSEAWALPQNFLPDAIKKDPLTHARFLFYVCHYMRGTIKSDQAIKRLISLWSRKPYLFDPEYVSRELLAGSELHAELGDYLGYKTDEIAHFWCENSRRLVRHWQGDPRRIFEGVTRSEEMYERITNKTSGPAASRGFLGFQEKMSSMIAYFLMEADLVAPFTASPPVDFHLLRVMLASGVLVIGERDGKKLRYEHLTPKGIEVLERYSREHGVSLVDLGNALWTLSVVSCSIAPGNGSTRREKGKKKRLTERPVHIPADWSDLRHVEAFLRSCEGCPLRAECKLNIPSGPYYEAGEFELYTRELPGRAVTHPLLADLELAIERKPLGKGNALNVDLYVPQPQHPGLFSGLPAQMRPLREL